MLRGPGNGGCGSGNGAGGLGGVMVRGKKRNQEWCYGLGLKGRIVVLLMPDKVAVCFFHFFIFHFLVKEISKRNKKGLNICTYIHTYIFNIKVVIVTEFI